MVEKIGLFIDEPETEKVALDFPNYIKAISELILNSAPMYTIGIFGNWGTGKTTLMKNVQKKLQENGCSCVEFNAWRFAQEENHATYPLMLTILTQLLERKEIQDKFETQSKKIKRSIIRVMRGLKGSMSVQIPSIFEGTIEADFEKMVDKVKDDLNGFLEENKPVLQEGLELIKQLIDESNNPSVNPDLKLVVFIDDLDRCTPEKATEVFESIKVFFELKGLVFVLGLSKEIIESAIDYKYEHLKPHFNGKDYLKKIIQIPFVLPPWTIEDVYNFIDSLIDKNKDLTYSEFFKNNKNLIIEASEYNPREIKRLLNNFILARSIQKNNKNIDDIKLLTVQALATRWKEFYDAISLDESILQKLSSKFRRGMIKTMRITSKINLENQIQEDPIITKFNKDGTLARFLRGEGNVILQISPEEWKLYRRAAIVEPEILPTEKPASLPIKKIELVKASKYGNPIETRKFAHPGGEKYRSKMPPELAETIEVNVNSSNSLKFEYVVPTKNTGDLAPHSSDLILHVKLDGEKLWESPLLGFEGREEPLPLTTGVLEITNLKPGKYFLTLQPQTREEFLAAWAGIVHFY